MTRWQEKAKRKRRSGYKSQKMCSPCTFYCCGMMITHRVALNSIRFVSHRFYWSEVPHGLAGVSAQGHARLKVSAGWAAFPAGALGPPASSFSLLQNSPPCRADWGPRTQLLEGTFRSQPQGPLTAQAAHVSKASQRGSLLWEPQGSLIASNLIKGRLSHPRHRAASSQGRGL